MSSAPRSQPELVRELALLLNSALLLFRDVRPNDAACLLAAKGYLLLRDDHRELAERLNGTLHLLTRELASTFAPSPAAELDVRPLPPAERHERIFQTWEDLPPGTAFVLVNDHDPKPLYYQFAAEKAGRFSWQPLEEGPERWRVAIGKTV
jgi:uncharacterized protein (DUF2249 family)